MNNNRIPLPAPSLQLRILRSVNKVILFADKLQSGVRVYAIIMLVITGVTIVFIEPVDQVIINMIDSLYVTGYIWAALMVVSLTYMLTLPRQIHLEKLLTRDMLRVMDLVDSAFFEVNKRDDK